MNGSNNRQKKSAQLAIHPGITIFFRSLLYLIAITPVSAADYWPGSEWRTATPESQGMRSEVLADMLDLILRKDYNIDGILVIQKRLCRAGRIWLRQQYRRARTHSQYLLLHQKRHVCTHRNRHRKGIYPIRRSTTSRFFPGKKAQKPRRPKTGHHP